MQHIISALRDIISGTQRCISKTQGHIYAAQANKPAAQCFTFATHSVNRKHSKAFAQSESVNLLKRRVSTQHKHTNPQCRGA